MAGGAGGLQTDELARHRGWRQQRRAAKRVTSADVVMAPAPTESGFALAASSRTAGMAPVALVTMEPQGQAPDAGAGFRD